MFYGQRIRDWQTAGGSRVSPRWIVTAHAQKPDFVFRRNRRVHLNRRRRQFIRLLAAEVCASAVVMLDTPRSEVVWRVLATHSIRQFPLHFSSRASPCAITFQLDSTTFQGKEGRSVETTSCTLVTSHDLPTRWPDCSPKARNTPNSTYLQHNKTIIISNLTFLLIIQNWHVTPQFPASVRKTLPRQYTQECGKQTARTYKPGVWAELVLDCSLLHACSQSRNLKPQYFI